MEKLNGISERVWYSFASSVKQLVWLWLAEQLYSGAKAV